MATQLKFNFTNNKIEDSIKENSFYMWCVTNNHKELLEEWDTEKNADITPKNTSYGTDKKVWWIKHYDDPKTGKHFDFSWQASISHRKGGRGCPYLSHPPQKIYIGFNDLATTHPSLVKDWAEEENNKINIRLVDVTYGSGKEVYWNCDIHGLYKAKISLRTNGTGCPYCAGKQVKIGYNDLKTKEPEIAKEWDTEKNSAGPESVTIGCTKKYWWKCEKGHSWFVSPNNRTNQRSRLLC